MFWKAECSHKDSILNLVIAPSTSVLYYLTLLAKYISDWG